jgi:hypothetical protein
MNSQRWFLRIRLQNTAQIGKEGCHDQSNDYMRGFRDIKRTCE